MSILTKAAKLRSRSRRASRGAALVEAAVVIPVMLVFAGLTMFSYRSYEMKFDKQMGTRAGTLYYASHSCTGDMPASLVPPSKPVDESADPGGDPLPGGNATDPSRLGGDQGSMAGASAGLKKSVSYAKSQPKDSPVFASVVNDRKSVPLNRMISAESEVACNEKSYPNKWSAMFKFLVGFAQQGGGLSSPPE